MHHIHVPNHPETVCSQINIDYCVVYHSRITNGSDIDLFSSIIIAVTMSIIALNTADNLDEPKTTLEQDIFIDESLSMNSQVVYLNFPLDI